MDIKKFAELGTSEKILPLFSTTEMAKRWGVSRQLVQKWKERHTDFCKPIYGIVEGPTLYYPAFEVERYERARKLKDAQG